MPDTPAPTGAELVVVADRTTAEVRSTLQEEVGRNGLATRLGVGGLVRAVGAFVVAWATRGLDAETLSLLVAAVAALVTTAAGKYGQARDAIRASARVGEAVAAGLARAGRELDAGTGVAYGVDELTLLSPREREAVLAVRAAEARGQGT